METSEAVEARIREKVEQLDQRFDFIVGMRVVVEEPHNHSRKGNLFAVSAEARVAGGEPVVAGAQHHDEQAHEDVYVAIRDTFDALQRRLEERLDKMRGQTKRHAEGETGR